MTKIETLERAFETALINLTHDAKDAQGRAVILHYAMRPGELKEGRLPSASGLRDTTIAFAMQYNHTTTFIDMSSRQRNEQAEVAFLRNLSLLASATAAAIELEYERGA